jgi:hypothetical protein
MQRVSEPGSQDVVVVDQPIDSRLLRDLAEGWFGDMVKAVVDVQRRIIALGGELHSDQELVLLEQGSEQSNLWGINIYPEKPTDERVEFDSMINIRPRQNNRSRYVEDSDTRSLIVAIVDSLIP